MNRIDPFDMPASMEEIDEQSALEGVDPIRPRDIDCSTALKGAFGDLNVEFAAACILFACIDRGSFGVVSLDEVEMASSTRITEFPWMQRYLERNFIPNTHGLVRCGAARMHANGTAHPDVELTEKGLRAIAQFKKP